MEQKFIEMAKTIFSSIDHYRESGRDDKFNIDSIAEYLQRQFLLQQTDVSRFVLPEQRPFKNCDLDATNLAYIKQHCDCEKGDCKKLDYLINWKKQFGQNDG